MKKTALFMVLAAVAVELVSAQTKEKISDVVADGKKLYWLQTTFLTGTNFYLNTFPSSVDRIGGYVAYKTEKEYVCMYYSLGDTPTVVGEFSFDGSFDADSFFVNPRERGLTDLEKGLVKIKHLVMRDLSSGDLFQFKDKMKANIIPLIDEKGKRAYVLADPPTFGAPVFGNDCYFAFDDEYRIVVKKRLHSSYLAIDYKKAEAEGKKIEVSFHTHLPQNGELITATDICTLMLYKNYAPWKKHIVVSEKTVSIWDCEKSELAVISREEWDKKGGKF